jgi:hypothetical protein
MADRTPGRENGEAKGGNAAPRRSPEVAMDDPEQSARFIEAAKELGCEGALDRFDEAVKRIGKARKPTETGVVRRDAKKERTPK